MLHKAILLAKVAHIGQLDKGGYPYIDHALRVMRRLDDEGDMAVAVLHDVLEDSRMKPVDLLAAGIPEHVVANVVTLTRKAGERYMDYIARCGRSDVTRRVKLADLEDNTDPARFLPNQPGLYLRYATAQEYLTRPSLYDPPGFDKPDKKL